MKWLGILALLAPATLVASVQSAWAQCEVDELYESDPLPHRNFGVAAVDGDTAVVTASSSVSSAAYVFELARAGWTESQELIPTGTSSGERFGASRAIDGDTIVVGAPGDYAYDDPGAAYVFERRGSTWQQAARLTASDGVAGEGDRFGYAVAIDRGRIVFGAPLTEGGAGAVYVFERGPTGWTEVEKLLARAATNDDRLGISVLLRGDRLLAGAPYRGFGYEGVVCVFARVGTGWVQRQALSTGTASVERYGEELALEGDTLAVGAPQNYDLGRVFLYVWDGTRWEPEDDLIGSEAEPYHGFDAFGRGLAFARGRLFVGAPGTTAYTGLPSPVYVFERGTTSWTEVARLRPRDGHPQGSVGSSLDAGGGQLLVGAPGDDDQGMNAGSLHVFEDPPAIGARYCAPAVPNSSGLAGVLSVQGCLDVGEDCLLLRATGLPPGPHAGIFLMGSGSTVFTPGGSAGPVCVWPDVRRFFPPTLSTSDLGGGFTAHVGTRGPISSAILPGSTWSFQAWYRDGPGLSNFTDAVSVTFE